MKIKPINLLIACSIIAYALSACEKHPLIPDIKGEHQGKKTKIVSSYLGDSMYPAVCTNLNIDARHDKIDILMEHYNQELMLDSTSTDYLSYVGCSYVQGWYSILSIKYQLHYYKNDSIVLDINEKFTNAYCSEFRTIKFKSILD